MLLPIKPTAPITSTPAAPGADIVAEDGTTLIVAEDGTTQIIAEQ